MLRRRPIIVWLISLFFGVPAVFLVVSYVLVFAGLVSPPPNLKSYFENADVAYFVVNGIEALFLVIAIALLFAMKRISFPLIATYFAIDTVHNLSGKYLHAPNTLPSLLVVLVVNLGVVAYVWNLRRKQLLV